ncbi:MAG TPA: zinc ribbon domain-containing protein [Candidatus Brevibacterium intestinigallinarum]|nr:zinc ribbon domain-containing protein [Candidatus Brevibacterium intestinigallinarum]
MILYDYRCEGDHRFEAAVASMSSPAPDCPDCGSSARRVLTTVRTSGFASAGHSREDMPKSWKGMGNGNRDAVDYWRRSMEKRERLEERHPELGGDRRPILAHEGIFRDRPLRAGDDIGASVQAAVTAEKAKEAAKPATATLAGGGGPPSSGPSVTATGSSTTAGGAAKR